MPIKTIELREFSAFEHALLPCVGGLNVFLGENGTGKSHALKAAYASLEALRAARLGRADLRGTVEAKLVGVFRPSGAVTRLIRRKHGQNAASIRLVSDRGVPFDITISVRGGVSVDKTGKAWGPARSVFLPTREVLALYPGFVALYDERELSFDETYRDACQAVGLPGLRGTRREVAERLAKSLRKALGGHTELKADGFYVKFDGDRAFMEAHLVAEGLRKLATLERLVINGTLTKNGYLFWDEPEANLNPKLTTVIADVLCSLASKGVQVFLATHDYLLLKQLDLQAARTQAPPTRFFLFDRRKVGAPVEVEHADRLDELSRNPVADEFIRIYERRLAAEDEDL
jgi:ABC-type transport system involved in cytochrome c biogenesis ATPase subunit